VDSAPRAYRLRAGNAAFPSSTSIGATPREIHEETALRCRSERLIGVYSDPGYQTVTYQDGRRFHFITAVFHVEAIGAAITGSAEGIEWGWFAPDDLPAPLTRYAEAWLLDALAPPSAPVVR
jgi:ADP-ribose pyrophosphatase YjhB (NUDIX family)